MNIVNLGDVNHTIARAKIEEWKDVPEFFKEVSKKVKSIKIMPGNHDGDLKPLIPSNVEILPSSGIVAQENIALIHDHAWPSLKLLKCKGLIMEHTHPVVAFKDAFDFRSFRQVWVKPFLIRKGLQKH
jgi:metallophosphoesterase superfamily enzyme